MSRLALRVCIFLISVSFSVQVSETLVLRNGDFLVRDSLTSVGDYVLTCRWDNEALHFKISKVLVKSNETKVRGSTWSWMCPLCGLAVFFWL